MYFLNIILLTNYQCEIFQYVSDMFLIKYNVRLVLLNVSHTKEKENIFYLYVSWK